jgi:O-antigen ligase
MDMTVNELDLGNRDIIFAQAIKQFIANPFLGDWFLLDHEDMTSSPHNAIVEAFSSLGIFGGISTIVLYITLIIKSFKILKYNSYLSFYASLCLFLIFYSITTGGTVLMKPDFNFAFLSILIISKKN